MKQTPEVSPRGTAVYTGWLMAIAAALKTSGARVDEVFSRAGMDYQALLSSELPTPGAATSRLWQEAVAETGDPAFGLLVSRSVHLTSFHALAMVFQCSEHGVAILHRMVGFERLMSNVVDLELQRDSNLISVSAAPTVQHRSPTDASFDASVSLIVRTLRGIAFGRPNPVHVELCRETPVEDEPYQRVFKCPISFGGQENKITWRVTDLLRPMPSANAHLARELDAIIEREIRARYQDNVSTQIQSLLLEQLPYGEPSQEKLAKQLFMSLRTLQRKLQMDGASYAALLDETRLHLAERYLAQEQLSLTEISGLLGFRNQSSFSRSFKRWTGSSPKNYRCDKARSDSVV